MVSGVLACLERPEAVGQAFNIGNPRSSVTIYDLAQRIKRLTGCPGEIVFAAARLRRRRAPHPERREGARAARLGAAGSSSTTASTRTIEWYRAKIERIRLARPEHRARTSSPRSRPCSRPGCSRRGPWSPSSRASSRAACETTPRARRLVGHGGAPRRGPRARARARATRCSSPPTPSRRPRTSSCSPGCEPVLVDVDPVTMNIDPEKVAVGAADEGGARRAPLRPAVPDRGAARPAGDRGRRRRARRPPRAGARAARSASSGCLSFHPRKIVTTGEGGAVTTDDERLAAAMAQLRNHGWRSLADADMPAPGLNYRLSDILGRGRAAPAAPARRAARRRDAHRGGLRRAARATCP